MTSAAIAIILKKERDVVEHFQQARALSPESAKTLGELNVDDGFAVRRLRELAVVRENSNGALYLDQLSWTALRENRRKRTLILIAIVLMASAAALSLTFFNAK